MPPRDGDAAKQVINDKSAQKKALESWEAPLRMPTAVPKPVGKKKTSRYTKKTEE